MTSILRNRVWKTTHELWQCLFSSPTLVLKSGGSVLAPVRRLTRKAFQFEYLCCMPARRKHKDSQRHKPGSRKQHWYSDRLTFWRYEGFAAWSTPADGVHFRDTQVTPEVFAGVIVKAFIPQESLEPCHAERNRSVSPRSQTKGLCVSISERCGGVKQNQLSIPFFHPV